MILIILKQMSWDLKIKHAAQKISIAAFRAIFICFENNRDFCKIKFYFFLSHNSSWKQLKFRHKRGEKYIKVDFKKVEA